MRAAAVMLCLFVMACTPFPDLDGVITPDVAAQDFPPLLPIEQVLNAATPVVADPVEATETLDARIAALRARAQVLQGRAVVDPPTRARMQEQFS